MKDFKKAVEKRAAKQGGGMPMMAGGPPMMDDMEPMDDMGGMEGGAEQGMPSPDEIRMALDVLQRLAAAVG